MKRIIYPVLFVSILLLISCTETSTSLKVAARPPEGVGDFTYYSCTIKQEGNTWESGNSNGIFHFDDVLPTETTINVSAYSGSEENEFIGSTTTRLDQGENNLELILYPRSPRSKDMVLHFPGSENSYLTITREGSHETIMKDALLENSRIDISALSYGKYRITVSTDVDGFPVRNVYTFTCSSETPEELVFFREETKPEDGELRIMIFDISSSPIEGRIQVRNQEDCITLELEVLKTTGDVREKDLEYFWYLNGEYLGYGKTVALSKENRTVRIDCVIKSRYLGSYGSESMSISISR